MKTKEKQTHHPPPPHPSPLRSLWRRTARDERGLSTLEWILLVAAVGGLATAGVIIVRNAVGGAGDQVDDDARTERLAQRDVNTTLRTTRGGGTDTDINLQAHVIRNRCSFDYKLNDGTYPLRKWRGSFTLRYVKQDKTLTTAQQGGSGDNKDHWCDAVPTNNLTNNPANFAEPIRTNFLADTCVTWPDGAGTPYANVNPRTNESC